MLDEFGRAGFLLLFALAFPILPIVTSVVLGLFKIRPRRPDPIKTATYECGVETEGDALGQFHVRYYVYALIFAVFSVSILLLCPLAVALRPSALCAAFAVVLFLLTLVWGFCLRGAKKALEWA